MISEERQKMCEGLNEELEEGRKVALALAEHLENMGMAEKASFPVETENGLYIIEIRRTL